MKNFKKLIKTLPVEVILFLSWFFPGFGHFHYRKYRRGMVYLALILGSILLGVLLQGRLYIPTKGEFLSYLGFLGNLGLGVLYLVLALAGYRGNLHAPASDYGTIYLLAAGLMQWLLLLEVHGLQGGKNVA